MDGQRFLELVRLSGLLDRNRLDTFISQQLHVGDEVPNAESLVAALIESNLLNDWQAKQLQRGLYRDLIFGPYRIVRPLAAERLVFVFEGEEMATGEHHVLKILRRKGRTNRPSPCLDREFDLHRRFEHPNIVRMFDNGIHGSDQYLSMELARGMDLDVHVKEHGPVEADRAVEIIRQAAAALAHVHSKGVVHRDIKPANFVLASNGTLKLIDFGIAIDCEEHSSLRAKNQWFLGTPQYCAPEQVLDGLRVDPRADLYGLGGVLYWLLTGNAPVPGDGNREQVMMQHLERPLTPVEHYRKGLPPALVDLCEGLLRKDPDDRSCQSAEEVCAAVEDVVRKGGHH